MLSNLPRDQLQGSEAHLLRAGPGSNHTLGGHHQGAQRALGDTGTRGISWGGAEFRLPVLWGSPQTPPISPTPLHPTAATYHLHVDADRSQAWEAGLWAQHLQAANPDHRALAGRTDSIKGRFGPRGTS